MPTEASGTGRYPMTGIALAFAITVAVVAIPLYLKSGRAGEAPAVQSEQPRAAVAGEGQKLPRFVELGTTSCAPCKVMLGVMAELEQRYPGEFLVEFVNTQERPAEAQRYGIRVIPTQLFYSPDGRELYRHTGVLRTEEIVAKWSELGYHFQPRRPPPGRIEGQP